MPDTLTTQHFRAHLLAQRAELLERMAFERGGVVGRAEVAADRFEQSPSDDAQLRSEREDGFAMNEHETAELQDIDRALERMTSGHYGECVDCEEIIPEQRLQATPTAIRCITCQTAMETQLSRA
jgi:DnaK suppressor protein